MSDDYKGIVRTHRSWLSMIARCTNPTATSYPRYGGRGITICPAWLGSFTAFMLDMGTRPEGMSLERKDNNGNYDPTNCKWATPIEQAGNTRKTRLIEHNGKTLPLSVWAREAGMLPSKLHKRLNDGWTMERALDPKAGHRFDNHQAPKGDGHHNTKLTDAKVAELRQRFVPYCRVNGIGAMAKELGMSSSYLFGVIKGTSRK